MLPADAMLSEEVLHDGVIGAIVSRNRAIWVTTDESIHEDPILTPPPTPEFLTKDFPSATRSRMEILTKENLVGAKNAPTAISRTFTRLLRGIRFPY